jgi:hypothetical protein
MRRRLKKRVFDNPRLERERLVSELWPIAFARICDFATFHANGEVDIDFDKACAVGAVVKVRVRKDGRGRTTTIDLPHKLWALLLLAKYLITPEQLAGGAVGT